MSVSSVSNAQWTNMLPAQPSAAGTNSHPNSHQDRVNLSEQAKLMQLNQSEIEDNKEPSDNESVRISSTIGKMSQITGLQREEVAALYRSIEKYR